MAILFVTSPTRGNGKTAVCAGLARHLTARGKKVGYFHALASPLAPDELDSDAMFMKAALSLKEPPEQLAGSLGSGGREASASQPVEKVGFGKDVMIIEGEEAQGKASSALVKALGARVLLVADAAATPDREMIAARKTFGENLLGVILNRAPRRQLATLQEQAPAAFAGEGIKVFGVLPEDRALLTFTVAELAGQIDGEFLVHDDTADRLVGSIMLGALTVDSGLNYFSQRSDKVALLKSSRPDLQLAALQTPTVALVLSGTTPLAPQVAYQADVKGVPVVQSRADVLALLDTVERALLESRFNQERKLPKMVELLKQHCDLAGLERALGIAE